MKKIYYILTCLFLISIIGCNKKKKDITEHVILKNVVKVMYGSEYDYSFFVLDTDTNIIRTERIVISSCGSYKKPEIIPDVLISESMWVEYDNDKISFGCDNKGNNIKIHIHSIADINGGGWNNGKFGRGQNNIIE